MTHAALLQLLIDSVLPLLPPGDVATLALAAIRTAQAGSRPGEDVLAAIQGQIADQASAANLAADGEDACRQAVACLDGHLRQHPHDSIALVIAQARGLRHVASSLQATHAGHLQTVVALRLVRSGVCAREEDVDDVAARCHAFLVEIPCPTPAEDLAAVPMGAAETS